MEKLQWLRYELDKLTIHFRQGRKLVCVTESPNPLRCLHKPHIQLILRSSSGGKAAGAWSSPLTSNCCLHGTQRKKINAIIIIIIISLQLSSGRLQQRSERCSQVGHVCTPHTVWRNTETSSCKHFWLLFGKCRVQISRDIPTVLAAVYLLSYLLYNNAAMPLLYNRPRPL